MLTVSRSIQAVVWSRAADVPEALAAAVDQMSEARDTLVAPTKR